MLGHLLAAVLQLPGTSPASPVRAQATDTVVTTDSVHAKHRKQAKRPPRALAVTAEHRATAFRDANAEGILRIARSARTRQDSALRSYDATTYQRISVGLGLSRFVRERLAFRTEQAAHVKWRQGQGADVEITGSRSVVPIAGSSGSANVNGLLSPVPYFPGSETLWLFSGAAKVGVDENDGLVHPLADGAEAYYTYESGDSVTFRLPGGTTILLRELRIRPREPKWNLAVGSLWFDMRGGQLVRAAYRMAVPMDIASVAMEDDSTAFKDVPAVMKPMLFPMTGQLDAIGVEYGLYQGRFWLPRLSVTEGKVAVGAMHAPVTIQQRFDYNGINVGEPIAPIVIAAKDSATQDVRVQVGVGDDDMPSDSARAKRRARHKQRTACDSTGHRTSTRVSEGGLNPVRITISCDSTMLARSPELPPSIYDVGDESVNGDEMQALVAQALSMNAQAGFSPQPPHVEMGRPRYNRIEGLSLGVRADQILGDGYSASADARIGLADRQPNVELTGTRSDLRRTLSLTAYNRLVSANDWGNPFGLGRSINAFVFGRDEGYYYRASGLEFVSAPDQPEGVTWSVFAEQERNAALGTTFSLAHAVRGAVFDTNLIARREPVAGVRVRQGYGIGDDPQGLRLFGDVRVEGAVGRESGSYGRIATEVTSSHGIGNGAVALTVGGGTSAGNLPPQRFWFLGGSQTVRGQSAGVSNGNAFWLARAEAAHGRGVVRPAVFADMGWAGDRTAWRQMGRPLSGAGIGVTMLDGLFRVDLARGIYPERQWRVESYLEARF